MKTNIQTINEEIDVKIIKEEILNAVKTLKNNKAQVWTIF